MWEQGSRSLLPAGVSILSLFLGWMPLSYTWRASAGMSTVGNIFLPLCLGSSKNRGFGSKSFNISFSLLNTGLAGNDLANSIQE